jgi:hypothetical protein
MRAGWREVYRPGGLRGVRAAAVCALVLILVLLAATPARAGTYDVYACNGGADNSWAQFADAGMAAYDSCPGNLGSLISGMTARASVGSGAVGYFRGAYQVFSAPPGTSLAQMTYMAAIYRWETFWSVGLVAFDGDFNQGDLPWGCYPGPGCGIVPFNFTGPYTVGLGGHTQVRIEARCLNPSGCTLATTGVYPYTRATFSISNVAVRVQDFTQPGVGVTGGALASGRWLSGVQGVSFDASDNVGIRETRVRVDGNEAAARGKPCDYSLRVPCPQGGDAYTLDTTVIRPDGAHTVTAEAVDTAGNVGQASWTALIDNSPPAQPVDLTVDGGEGWRARNGFRLSWRNPPGDGGSPVTGASYEICSVNGDACQRGSQDGDAVSAVDGIRVPQAGEYIARLWLRDGAGNEDLKTAGPPIPLRFDDEAPELAFVAQGASEPTRVAVRASDRVSGVAGGEIEFRRKGSGGWQALATRLDGSQLVANLDDENLPDGTYELRARAFDRAGNERSTGLREDGQEMELALPVRIKTLLKVGIVKRAHRQPGRRKSKRERVQVLKRSRISFGHRARLVGRLTDASGAAIADADVLAFQAPRTNGASFTLVATLKTSSAGRFTYIAPKGTSRTLRFRYRGTATVRPATGDAVLLVAASTTFRTGRHFALNGESVTFSGRLRGGSVPPGGKLIELQAHVRNHWRTFATTEADVRGYWQYPYRFDGTRGRQVYRFRARVPREATYPYEDGHSGQVKVTVVGL